jgi:hypothetical protein
MTSVFPTWVISFEYLAQQFNLETALRTTVGNKAIIQDYWISGLCPSSGILKNAKEHNASEAGSVFALG